MLRIVILMALAATTAAAAIVGTTQALMGQVLELDPPNQNGSEIRQVTIRPNDHTFLFSSNKTAIIQIGGMAEDVDFKETPPPGISVVIDNKSVTVTKLPVGIPAALANASGSDLPPPSPAAAAVPAPVVSDTSNGDGGDGDGDGDEGDDDDDDD